MLGIAVLKTKITRLLMNIYGVITGEGGSFFCLFSNVQVHFIFFIEFHCIFFIFYKI